MLYEVITVTFRLLIKSGSEYDGDVSGVITSYSIHYTKLYDKHFDALEIDVSAYRHGNTARNADRLGVPLRDEGDIHSS